jgi:hypothetical protein
MSFRRAPLRAVTLAAWAWALAAAEAMPERADVASWLDNLDTNASVAASWVENASRTSFAPTRKDAAIYELNLGVSRHQQLTGNWSLSASADADYLSEPAFDRNSQLRLGPTLGVQRKFGLGPLAPVLQLDAGFSYKSARITADNGWTAEAGVRFAKRILPELKIAASGRWLEHYAKSATFDLQQRTLALEAVWDIDENWQLSGTASWLQGRVVANAAWPVWTQAIGGGLGQTVSNYYNSIPWEITDSYGPRWVSYNVAARANLLSVTLSRTLTERTSLELRYGSAYVINKIDLRYPTDSWGLALTHRF